MLYINMVDTEKTTKILILLPHKRPNPHMSTACVSGVPSLEESTGIREGDQRHGAAAVQD